MADVTVAGELQLMFAIDARVPYEVMEDAIVAEGFEDYTISRNVAGTRTDVMITLRAPTDENGQSLPFEAGDTLAKVATAVSHFGDEPEPEA